MGKADLHVHSIYSWDGVSSLEEILSSAKTAGLDVIAITDHDAIEGALRAVKLASRHPIEVIPGVEISTADGHLIALFVEGLFVPGRPALETVLEIGARGGIAIAPHPMVRTASSLSAEVIRGILAHPEAGQVLVGMEAYNGGLLFRGHNEDAKALCQETNLSWVGSSDAHLSQAIGSSATVFPGKSPDDLRIALQKRLTTVTVRPRNFPLSTLLLLGVRLVWKYLRRRGPGLRRGGATAPQPAPQPGD
jgi:predicted metal-dependent phosphoesterase TrpH